MKNLQTLLEGIFDIDNNIENVDKEAITSHWFNELSNVDKYPKNINNFIKNIVRDGGIKTSKNKLDENKAYICIKKKKSTMPIFTGGHEDFMKYHINFIYPDERYRIGWFLAQIEVRSYNDNASFNDEVIYRNRQLFKFDMVDMTTIYELPENYYGIINKIIEKDKY